MDSPCADRPNIEQRLYEVVNERGEQVFVFNSGIVHEEMEASTSNPGTVQEKNPKASISSSGTVQQKHHDTSTSNSGTVQEKNIEASTSNYGTVEEKSPEASPSDSGTVQQNLDPSISNPQRVTRTRIHSNELQPSKKDSPETSNSNSVDYLVNEDVTPPEFPSEYDSSSNEETYSDDSGDFMIESDQDDDAVGELHELPQIRLPMRNYTMDEEHEEDFADDWMWVEPDPGASHGPFIGNPGLNIRPDSNRPIDYFRLFFDDAMYTKIANETNEYARQRIRKRRGYYLFIYLFIYF